MDWVLNEDGMFDDEDENPDINYVDLAYKAGMTEDDLIKLFGENYVEYLNSHIPDDSSTYNDKDVPF